MVLVRDQQGVPVRGAPVNFAVRLGGGHLLDSSIEPPSAPVASLTATTGHDGIARVRFVPGSSTYDNAVSYTRQGDRYGNVVGENLVDARLESGSLASLPAPMAILGFAGLPDPGQLEILGDHAFGSIFSTSGMAHLLLRDRFGNPVANHPVTFASQAAVPEPASDCSDLGNFPAGMLQAQLIAHDDRCGERMPTWGECLGAQARLPVVSNSDGGAGVMVVLGAVPFASYPLLTEFATGAGPATRTFSHHAWGIGACTGTGPPANSVMLQYRTGLDEYGNNVDARPAGVTVPMQVKAYLLGEGETIRANGQTLTCDGSSRTCDRVVGDGRFELALPDSLAVTLGGQTAVRVQDGTTTASTVLALHQAQIAFPLGLNELKAEATVVKDLLTIDNSCTRCGTPTIVPTELGPFSRSWQIWGVRIATPPALIAPVSSQGYLLQELPFTYSILPAPYRAGFAQVLLYRNGILRFVARTAETGSPTLVFPAGYWFDRNSRYELEVILNNPGESNEIRSGRIPLLPIINMVDLRVSALPDDQEESAGAFLLLNNDLDEGRIDPASGKPLKDNEGGDAMVQPDDEIKKAYLAIDGQGVVSSGRWQLTVTEGESFRIYRDDGQGGFVPVPLGVPQAVTLPAVIPLYLEGVAVSAGLKTGGVRAVFTPDGYPEQTDDVAITVVDFDLAVDGNRDRNIDFDIAEDESMLFWVNNDRDVRSWSWEDARQVEDDAETGNDSLDEVISCQRDLEDFARLLLKVEGNLPPGELTFSLRMEPAPGAQALPVINLFPAVHASDKYLGFELAPGDNQPAAQLLQSRLATVGPVAVPLPAGLVAINAETPLLFEGRAHGQGRLVFAAAYGGVTVLEKAIDLSLFDISYFYDHFVLEATGNPLLPVEEAISPARSRHALYQPANDDYLL
ncbi:MAG: Ig-like domain-containing protein, partial [Desulfuromonadales bacterium]|nr:Ig-like domain-containing protein [Desulfuromonadales bacterium]